MVFIGALDSDLLRLCTAGDYIVHCSLRLCLYFTIITDKQRVRSQHEEEEEDGGGAAAGAAGAGDDGGAARTREGVSDISRLKKSTSSSNTHRLAPSLTTYCVLRNSIDTFTLETEDEVDPDAALLRRQARLLAGQQEAERREAESSYRLQLLRIR